MIYFNFYVLIYTYYLGTSSESIPQTATQPAISSPPKPTVSRVVSSTRLVNPPPRPSGNTTTKIPNPVVGVKRRSSPHKEESPKKTKTEEVSVSLLVPRGNARLAVLHCSGRESL